MTRISIVCTSAGLSTDASVPVMRLHGNRNPQEGYGAEQIGSGSDNEIWSFW